MEYELDSRKNDDRSKAYVHKGDRFFDNYDFVKAIEAYNASICYALPYSSQLIGYMKRAKVYTKLGLHKEALRSLEMAMLTETVDDDCRVQIYQQRERCVDKIGNDVLNDCSSTRKKIHKKVLAEPQITHNFHKKVPFASECLEVMENKFYGRYLTTNKDLVPGQILSIEPAYCRVLDKRFIYKKCTHCLKSNHFNLFPCSKCSMAMFCSEKCMELSETYHKYECSIMGLIFNVFCDTEHGSLPWMALRQLLLTLRWYWRFQDLIKLLVDAESDTYNFQRFNFETAVQKSYMQYILSLTTKPLIGEEYDQIKEICDKVIDTLICKSALREDIREYAIHDATFNLDKYREVLTRILIRFFYVNLTNVYSLVSTPEWWDKSEAMRNESFALAVFPFTTLINHACACNVKALFVGEGNASFMIYASRPIAAGKQIFITYQKEMNYLETPLEQRRQTIWNEFGFICGCVACINNYAIASKLKHMCLMSNEEKEFVKENYRMLEEPEKCLDAAKRAVKMYGKMLVKYEKQYPCLDVNQVELLLDHCMLLLYRNRPFSYEL